MSRTPLLVAVSLGAWVQDWRQWSVDRNRLVVWVEDLPTVDEADRVDLTYYGPVEGDTATALDVPIERIEPAHGGFHIGFDAGVEFVDQFRDRNPPDGQTVAIVDGRWG